MMQYYYATPGGVSSLGDIKDEARKFVDKVRSAFDSMSLGDKKLDGTQKKLDQLKPLIRALPNRADQDSASRQHDAMQSKVNDLRGRVSRVKSDLKRVWDELKQLLGLSGSEVAGLGGLGALGVVWYILVGLIAAALFAAGKLWKEVVNETGRMNTQADALRAVVEGKLPPEVLLELKKQGNGGAGKMLDLLPKLAIAAVVLFALPGLVKMVRRDA